MKVEDIRKDEYVEEYVRLHAADVEDIVTRKDSFRVVDCPACGRAEHAPRFEKSGFRFVECAVCGTLFVNPRPDAELLSRFYSSARSFDLYNTKIFPASESSRKEHIFVPRVQRVVQLCRSHLSGRPETIVDVGAGFGTFGEEMKRVGFFDRVIAVEPAPGLAATCRSKGLEVIEEPIEKVTLAKATVVTCFELIEHLFSPEQFLRACGRVLSKDGLLILTTPNIAGFDLRLLGAISENIDAPEHLNYYHPASLRRLLERCGFLVVEILTPGRLDAELVRKKALAGLVDLTNSPFLRRVLLDDWETLGGPFQDFLAEQGLSSHMWAVARKAADSTVRV